VIYAGSGRGATAVKLAWQGDALTGAELWSNQDNSVQFNTPVLTQGLVIGLNQGNELFCIDAKTGKTLWTAPTAVAAAGEPPPTDGGGQRGRGRGRGPSGFGSVIAAGSVAMALTQNPELIVFEPKRDGFHEVADSPTHAHPVVSGNRFFIKDQNSVALLTMK
jgi:outer membrane protein assembly factor BamB